MQLAEKIPLEPEQDNACEGKQIRILECVTPVLFRILRTVDY